LQKKNLFTLFFPPPPHRNSSFFQKSKKMQAYVQVKQEFPPSAVVAEPVVVPPVIRNAAKRQRVVAQEKEDDEKTQDDDDPLPQLLPRCRYLTVAAAAKETGLPVAVVKSWASQGHIDTLKPGSDNSHRLVEMVDLLRFVELKRERARTDVRKELEEAAAAKQRQ